ncbi:hypothetical protein EYF80_053876 [Liparis tanakae]|uniref:Uncharacterized protein n=1 Tax=Liparis tanakae TaxID=230148 RepID=A0A4Z2F491_9TELE|nr:hypothetical protein EYF80_053876 [Liparis tanakae]
MGTKRQTAASHSVSLSSGGPETLVIPFALSAVSPVNTIPFTSVASQFRSGMARNPLESHPSLRSCPGHPEVLVSGRASPM